MATMASNDHIIRFVCLFTALGIVGCQVPPPHAPADLFSRPVVPAVSAPNELEKAVLPTYRIEPPDVLVIDVVNLVPRAPYRLKTLDTISIFALDTLPEEPIAGPFTIEPGGMVNLGVSYGGVKVAGLTTREAKAAIEAHLAELLAEAQVSVSLVSIASQQQIAGEHLVQPDGRISLGSYGSVKVVGMTLEEAQSAVENHLSSVLEDPVVSVSVFAFNSKTYYVITQGAGLGDNVFRFPNVGNETVLDAVSQIQGLGQVASKRIWIARPGKNGEGCDQILSVNWEDIAQKGNVCTNYQVLPGDRVYIAEDKLIAFDNHIAKVIAPVQRLMGFSILGAQTATRLSSSVLTGGGNPFIDR